MYALIVDCGGFPLEHSAYVMDMEGQMENIVHLPTAEIAGYANSRRVNKIFLQGPSEYCLGIKEEIAKQLRLEYSNNDIEIEVI